MTARAATFWTLLLALGCTVSACPTPPPPPDAGPTPVLDAGTPDAAVEVDAGRPVRDAGTPDAGFTHVEAAGWCDAHARAQCFRDVRCGRVSADAGADCVQRRLEGCDQVAFTRGTAEGRLQFLATEGVRCLNDFATGSCQSEPTSCAAVFSGLVPADGGCVTALECDPGAFCFMYDNVCPHHCRGWAPPGAPCDSFNQQCDPATSVCDSRDGGPQSCLSVKQEGDSCVGFSSCGAELTCVDAVCTRRTAALGEVCNQHSGYPYCPDELFCRYGRDGGAAPGTCQLRAGLGATCVGNGSCLPSLRCTTVITTGTCQPKASLGAGCVAWDDCEDGLFCDQAAQQCAALPVDGGDCGYRGSGYRCATGYACDFTSVDDVCVARRANGQPCSYSSLCQSGECVYGSLADGGFGGQCSAPCSQRADGGF
jgi:hypothetical protein